MNKHPFQAQRPSLGAVMDTAHSAALYKREYIARESDYTWFNADVSFPIGRANHPRVSRVNGLHRKLSSLHGSAAFGGAQLSAAGAFGVCLCFLFPPADRWCGREGRSCRESGLYVMSGRCTPTNWVSTFISFCFTRFRGVFFHHRGEPPFRCFFLLLASGCVVVSVVQYGAVGRMALTLKLTSCPYQNGATNAKKKNKKRREAQRAAQKGD